MADVSAAEDICLDLLDQLFESDAACAAQEPTGDVGLTFHSRLSRAQHAELSAIATPGVLTLASAGEPSALALTGPLVSAPWAGGCRSERNASLGEAAAYQPSLRRFEDGIDRLRPPE